METALTQHSELVFEGSTQFVARTLFHDLFHRIGDHNVRLRDRIEQLLVQMSGHRLVGPTIVLQNATKFNIEQKSGTSHKHIVGRMQLVHKILEKHPRHIEDQQQLANILKFAKSGFKHQNNDVRVQSFHVILECYKTVGKEIKPHLNGLRLAQQEMLDKGFASIDQANAQ